MLQNSHAAAVSQPVLTYEEFKRLFIDDVVDHKQSGLDVHALLCEWEKNPFNAPSMRNIMDMAGDAFGIDKNAKYFDAALTAGDLGHEKGTYWPEVKKEFHAAPDHPRKVLLQTIRLISSYNSAVRQGMIDGPVMTGKEISMLMAIAATHDLGHDGMGNGFGTGHRQYRLEENAFAAFATHFGSDFKDEMEKIHTVFMCTDPSSKDGPLQPKSPMIVMRDFYRKDIEIHELPDELKGLADKRTLLYSKIINIADSATSAAVSENRTRRESWYLSQEVGDPNIAKDSSSAWFVETVGVTQDFLPAQMAYGDNPERIIEILKRDNQNNLNFPPPA